MKRVISNHSMYALIKVVTLTGTSMMMTRKKKGIHMAINTTDKNITITALKKNTIQAKANHMIVLLRKTLLRIKMIRMMRTMAVRKIQMM